jgi:hypothetical protein
METYPSLDMSLVDLDPPTVDVVLRAADAGQLKDRVEFGGPRLTPIDEQYKPDDADLQAFIRGQKDLRFVLAHMSINFPFSRGPALVSAAVAVSLDDSAQSGDTIAWSLFPTHAGNSREVNQGWSLSPSATVGPVTAALGSISRTTTDHVTVDFVTGGPELSAHPSWQFRPTANEELTGSTRLIMVIQLPKESVGSLRVSLGANVEEGRFFKKNIPLPGADEVNPDVVGF